METRKKTKSSSLIHNEDINLVTGFKTHYLGREGDFKRSVAVKESVRDAFFNQRRKVQALLKRIRLNPLLEEGIFRGSYDRDQNGEFFITPEAFALLAEKTFVEDNKNGKYNTKNLLFCNNDPYKLIAFLQKLQLTDGEDAKILYVDQLHGISFYIRNVAGMNRVFIVDSQASNDGYYPHTVIGAILIGLKNVDICINSTVLQKDTYSCFTFAFLALKYFAAHGDKVFPHIDKNHTEFDFRAGCNVLPADRLMPELIKLNQSNIPLADDVLDAVVSKKGTTVREYMRDHTIVESGKKINTAALAKKYKFFDKIDMYISSHTKDEINSEASSKLPVEIDQTCKKYFM